MGTSRVTKIKFIRALKEKGIVIFDPFDLRRLFNLKSDNTVKHLLRRLAKDGVVKRLKKGKYLFNYGRQPSDFLIANSLVVPSYISLESALSYYGLIDQFPYRITSVTVGKPRQFKINNKDFFYSKIKRGYFKDYVKVDDFLIAAKHKALFDYLYFIYKGLRAKNVIEELSAHLKDGGFKKYSEDNADRLFKKFLKAYVK